MNGWLVYRVTDVWELEVLGLYQTKEAATDDIELMPFSEELRRPEWLVVEVPFVGWGQVAPGVFSQNGPAPLRLVKGDN